MHCESYVTLSNVGVDRILGRIRTGELDWCDHYHKIEAWGHGDKLTSTSSVLTLHCITEVYCFVFFLLYGTLNSIIIRYQ